MGKLPAEWQPYVDQLETKLEAAHTHITEQSVTIADLDVEHGKVVDKLNKWVSTAEKLRKGIQDFLEGEYHHPRSCRPMPCEHDNYWWEDCSLCDEAHFTKLLEDNKC